MISNVKGIYCKSLCESLAHMPFLSYLHVVATDENEVLRLNALPPNLQKLNLNGRLAEETFSEFQAMAQNLYLLDLSWSQLREDPLPTLSRLANLTVIFLVDGAYSGEKLEFLTGWFPKLKNLHLRDLHNLKQLEIKQGAMATLETFTLRNLRSMAAVPFGLEFLMTLEYIDFGEISHEFLALLRQCPGLVNMRWYHTLRD
jgi:disease resistance protein RPM1